MRPSWEDILKSRKNINGWWPTIVHEPFELALTWLIAPYQRITPNLISLFSFTLGVTASALLIKGTWLLGIAGAVVYELSHILDGVDGKIARLRKMTSLRGDFLDKSFDCWKELLMASSIALSMYPRWEGFAAAGLFVFGRLLIAFQRTLIPETHEIINEKQFRSPGLMHRLEILMSRYKLAGNPLGTVELQVIAYVFGPILDARLVCMSTAALLSLLKSIAWAVRSYRNLS